MRTLTSCPHCRAIIDDSPFCTICGKSPRQTVEEIEPPPPPDRVAAVDRPGLLRQAVSGIGIIAVVALIWAWTRPPESNYVARPLPAPTAADVVIHTDATAPSVEATGSPTSISPFAPVGDAAAAPGARAPWEDPPLTNLVTGEPLGDADYTASLAHVSDLLDSVPDPWSLAPPSATIATEQGIDLAEVEATQPFAARSLIHEELGPIGDLWIVAAEPDDPAGAAYVAGAQSTINPDDVIETLSPRPGIRVQHLVVDGIPLWFADIAPPSAVLFFVPGTADPTVLAAFLEDWQYALLDPVA